MKLPWHTDVTEPLDEPRTAVIDVHPLESSSATDYEQPVWTRPAFAPKPPDLLAAAGIAPVPPVPSLLDWTQIPPGRPGLYWWRNPGQDASSAYVDLVVEYGATMAVVLKHADSTVFRSVSVLNRLWSGPIPTPPGMNLEYWWGLR